MTEDKFLTDDHVMDFFGVSKRTLQKLVAEGKIPSPVKIGGLNRWRNSDLQKFISEAKPKEG
jgi:excisionase family DNA binding protein